VPISKIAKLGKRESQYTAIYIGAKYYSAIEEHLGHFRIVAKMYLPQCDGYGVHTVAANSEKMRSDPETFKIDDRKLLSVLTEWNKDEEILLNQLSANWEKLKAAN